MHEQRRHPRFDLADEGWRATLTDQVTGESLGEVVNLSLGGMMVLGPAALQAEHLYQIELVATGPRGQAESFSAGVLALWATPAGRPGTSWTGFEIIDIGTEERERLAALTGSFSSGEH